MVNYIHGEFYKVLRRKYPYICLALLLAGAGLLVWGWAFTNAHGNHVDFAAGGGMAVSLLAMGMCLWVGQRWAVALPLVNGAALWLGFRMLFSGREE